MITIGLTGGIGSGKSTVAKVFEAMGYSVYNSDKRAKLLMVQNEDIIIKVKQLFGEDIYSNNILNKKKLGAIVFNNKEKLTQLNNIVHPAVALDFKNWTSNQHTNIVLKEAAIIFEIGGYKQLDYTILVTAPKEERIRRTRLRDNASREEIIARMKNQWEDEQKIPLASFIIDNSGEKLVTPQVIGIINKIKSNE